MKISRIRLTNFRNHRDTEIELDRLNIFCGPNASGKSSIKQALEVALTGRCETTDRGGRGADDLIRVGEKKATVAVELDSVGEVTRVISPSGSRLQVSGWSGGAKVQQTLLMNKLDTTEEVVRVVCRVADFPALAPKEQQKLLEQVCGTTVTRGQILAALEDAGLSEEILAEIPEDVSLAWLDQAYRQAYDERREAKRALDEARGRLAGLEETTTVADVDPDLLPDMRRQLEALKNRRAELERLLVQTAEARQQRERLITKIRELELYMVDLHAQRENLEAETGVLDEEEIVSIRRNIDQIRERLSRLAGEIKTLDEGLAALKKAKGACPLAPAVACPLTGDKLRKLSQEVGEKRRKLAQEHKAAQDDLMTASLRQDELLKVLDAKRRCDDLEGCLTRAEANLVQLREELAGLDAGAGIEDEALTTELEQLEARITRGHHLIAEAELVLRNREARERAEKAVAELTDRVETLEKLVAVLSPGPEGVRARLVSAVIQDLRDRVNENLSAIVPYRLAIGDDLALTVEGPSGTEFKHLSTSERLRVGLAIAEALAYLAGLRLFILDDAEILDDINRAAVSAWLMRRAQDHDTILILSTSTRERLRLVPGVRTYWIEDGRVMPLEVADGQT